MLLLLYFTNKIYCRPWTLWVCRGMHRLCKWPCLVRNDKYPGFKTKKLLIRKINAYVNGLSEGSCHIIANRLFLINFICDGVFWILLTVRWHILMSTVGLSGYIRAAMHMVGTLQSRPWGDNGRIYHSIVLILVPCLLSLGLGDMVRLVKFSNTHKFSFTYI